jgi:hypothetical protein
MWTGNGVHWEMSDKCSICKMNFQESTTQFCRRLKDESPKICPDCNRIEQAERRAIARTIARDQSPEQSILVELRSLQRKNKGLSVPYLMRKMKMSHQEATEMCSKFP